MKQHTLTSCVFLHLRDCNGGDDVGIDADGLVALQKASAIAADFGRVRRLRWRIIFCRRFIKTPD